MSIGRIGKRVTHIGNNPMYVFSPGQIDTNSVARFTASLHSLSKHKNGTDRMPYGLLHNCVFETEGFHCKRPIRPSLYPQESIDRPLSFDEPGAEVSLFGNLALRAGPKQQACFFSIKGERGIASIPECPELLPLSHRPVCRQTRSQLPLPNRAKFSPGQANDGNRQPPPGQTHADEPPHPCGPFPADPG